MSDAQAQMQYIPLDELEYGRTRYIRENVVEEIKERIETDGYNPARPLRVIPENGHYVVADGNHRLETLNELREAEHRVPCVVEEDGDLYEIARESNRDEDTYAPEDLFDHLYKIDELRESGENFTQEDIAEKMGDEWSRSKVSQYAVLLDNVATDILELARDHQEGRVAEDATTVANFTERWFRDSGLYDLHSEPEDAETGEVSITGGIPAIESVESTVWHPTNTWKVDELSAPKLPQQRLMEWFIYEQKCDVGKRKLERKKEDIEGIQTQLGIINEELNSGVDEAVYEDIRDEVLENAYTEESLRDVIEAANLDAQDQAYFGADSVEKLQEFEENEIACVVTDPPWGVEHTTHRPNELPEFDGDLSDTMKLWAEVCSELQRVCKDNAHLYVFFPSRHYTAVREVLETFFEIDPVPLQWVKNNHKPTRDTDGFKKKYVYQYESAFFCRMPNGESRELNKDVSPNVLHHDVPKGDDDRWHSTQKPISLFEELLTNSTGTGETIMDPFAGSGSALLAAKRSGRHYIGIEIDDSYESRFKKELRKIEDGGDSDE